MTTVSGLLKARYGTLDNLNAMDDELLERDLLGLEPDSH
jgi:hypothetical protein